MSAERVLPADVYDALELSALAFGGIGRREYFDCDGTPLCAVGHLTFAKNTTEKAVENEGYNFVHENDDAVAMINTRHGAPLNARVTFADWCAELGVERGS